MEDVSKFGVDHPHNNNKIVFKSSLDTYLFLDGLARVVGSTHDVYFNNGISVMRKELMDTQWSKSKSGLFSFECVPGSHGDFESETYYGYDVFMGYSSKSTKRGYICPSVIVHLDANGISTDTGSRLLRILRTRCSKPEIHALVYSVVTDKVEVVKKCFLQDMMFKYTVWHLPFEYDATIKG